MKKSPAPIRKDRNSYNASDFHYSIWAILFYINLFVAIYIFYYVIDRTIEFKSFIEMIFSLNDNSRVYIPRYVDTKYDNFYQMLKLIQKCFNITLIGIILVNIFHFIYSIIFPSIYVNVNLFANLLLFLFPALFLAFKKDITGSSDKEQNFEMNFYFLASSMLGMIGISLFIYRHLQIRKSSSMMKTSSTFLLKHPSLFLVEIIQDLFLLIINTLYIVGMTVFQYNQSALNVSPIVYSYFGFSYYWILMTIYYVNYMTTASVVGNEFFFGNQSSTSNCTVLNAFNKVISKQFGCTCYAALFVPISQIFVSIKNYLKPVQKDIDNRKEKSLIKNVLKTIFIPWYYLLVIVDKLVKNCNIQLPTFCQIWGSSYSDACSRWKNLNCSSKYSKIQNSSMISSALLTNYFLSNILGITFSFVLCFCSILC